MTRDKNIEKCRKAMDELKAKLVKNEITRAEFDAARKLIRDEIVRNY